MRHQEKILREIAKRHKLSPTAAKEIYHLWVQCIVDNISAPDKKNKEGYYIPEKFKTIHIDNFGKFVPRQNYIRHANYCIEKQLKDED